MQEKENMKQEIIELVRATHFQPEQIEAFPGMVQVYMNTYNKSGDAKIVAQQVIQKVTSNSFLDPFVDHFQKIFSLDEIRYLLEVYRSEPMRKYFQNGSNLFVPIYQAYRQLIDEIVRGL